MIWTSACPSDAPRCTSARFCTWACSPLPAGPAGGGLLQGSVLRAPQAQHRDAEAPRVVHAVRRAEPVGVVVAGAAADRVLALRRDGVRPGEALLVPRRSSSRAARISLCTARASPRPPSAAVRVWVVLVLHPLPDVAGEIVVAVRARARAGACPRPRVWRGGEDRRSWVGGSLPHGKRRSSPSRTAFSNSASRGSRLPRQRSTPSRRPTRRRSPAGGDRRSPGACFVPRRTWGGTRSRSRTRPTPRS